ncbi:hypothetical protein QFC19_004840 [Naganishia cerealis]|uniref:Uncharacterized protein n=1 Tax=Naganishia cerealis TaxID=610337 RepID=A0ACC2VSY7_9TREE|nr:hypothetical protein QFC19_004840 [Naganishia cerealis]
MVETTKKKHRPVELDLNVPNKVEAALRIVSPGLPKLSPGMQTTMNESMQIQRQQRELIAARNNTEPGVEVKEPTSVLEKKVVVITTSNPDSEVQDSSRLSTPSTTKRLKRENAPPPLSLVRENSEKSPSMRPLIQSAPLRPYFMGPHAKGAFKPYGSNPYTPHRQLRRLHVSPPRRIIRPFTAHAAHPQLQGVYPRYTAAPYTAVAGSFPRVPYRHVSGPLPYTKSPVLAQVTDVYHGDYTRVAPFTSQPLSAQQDAFEGTGAVADRTLATEEEMIEMKRKHEQASKGMSGSESDDSDDPELNAIDPEDQPLRTGNLRSRSLTIFGSINLMNESVFNFKIYASSKKQEESKDSTPASNSNGDLSEKVSLPSSHSPEKSPVTLSAETTTTDLQKQKEKFLKICETSWDEFVSTMG